MWMTFGNMIRQELEEAKWRGRMRCGHQSRDINCSVHEHRGEAQWTTTANLRGLVDYLPFKKNPSFVLRETRDIWYPDSMFENERLLSWCSLFLVFFNAQIFFLFPFCSVCKGELTGNSFLDIVSFSFILTVERTVAGGVCTQAHFCGGQKTTCWSWFSPSITWILGVRLKSSG